MPRRRETTPVARRGCMAVLGALAVLTAPETVLGQAPGDLPEGTKVRVTAPPLLPKPTVGTVAGWPTDSLIIQNTVGGHETMSRASLTRLEVSRGTKSKVLLGALIGLGVGVAMGVALATAMCSGDPDSPCSSHDTATVAAVLALPGALLGAGVGLLIRVDRWEDVPLSQLSRTSSGPVRGSVGIALKL